MKTLAQIKKEGSTIDYGDGSTAPSEKTSWLELIEFERLKNGDRGALVRVNGDTSARFNNGYGGVYKAEWILWTASHVYIPSIFDGNPSIVSVPREPSDFIYSIDELGY